jgi:hypothetical protein
MGMRCICVIFQVTNSRQDRNYVSNILLITKNSAFHNLDLTYLRYSTPLILILISKVLIQNEIMEIMEWIAIGLHQGFFAPMETTARFSVGLREMYLYQ